MFRRTAHLLFSLCLLCLIYSGFGLPIAQADSLQITALVKAQADDFQLLLNSQPAPGPLKRQQIITFTLNYGSYLTHPTDSIVVIAHWQQNSTMPSILKYVDNSATPAIQGSQPHVNVAQQTITWMISPMPPGLNRQVSWQLQIDPSAPTDNQADLAVTASLTASGLQLVSQPLRFTYLPTGLAPTPSQLNPTPTTSQPTPPATQPTANPTANPTAAPTVASPHLSTDPTISPTGWLALLTLFLIIAFIVWLIRRSLWQTLWLFYRHRTLLHGVISYQGQPLSSARIIIMPIKQSIHTRPLSTTTNRHGHYQRDLSPNQYIISVIQDNHSIYQQGLTIHSWQRGQRLELSLSLPLDNATMDTYESSPPSSTT